jgi:hypothetical protein
VETQFRVRSQGRRDLITRNILFILFILSKDVELRGPFSVENSPDEQSC